MPSADEVKSRIESAIPGATADVETGDEVHFSARVRASAFDGLTRDPPCAFFVDLRFLTPGRDGISFRFGACRDAPGAAWRLLPPQ